MNKDYFNLMGLKTMNRSNNDGNDSDDFGATADDNVKVDDGDDSIMQIVQIKIVMHIMAMMMISLTNSCYEFGPPG